MPPSNDDDDAKMVGDAIETMKAAMRAERQARLANAINDVPDLARMIAINGLRELTDYGVRDFQDMEIAAFLAAVVHDDATWDAVAQVRQLIEALRGKKDQP